MPTHHLKIAGSNQNVTVGPGNVKVVVAGSNDQVTADAGPDKIKVVGDMDQIQLGASASKVELLGNNDGVVVAGNMDKISLGTQTSTVQLLGNGDSVVGGGHSTITFSGTDETFVDGKQPYAVVVFGWASGDHLHLTTDPVTDALAVEPQQVVLGKTEAADRCSGFQASMGAMPIVAMQPVDQLGRSFAASFDKHEHRPIRRVRFE
jgi:hypothetical protein